MVIQNIPKMFPNDHSIISHSGNIVKICYRFFRKVVDRETDREKTNSDET